MAQRTGTFFEDFRVGDVFVHQRGRTVEQFDNYAITHMSMNTAQAHFNLAYSQQLLDGKFPERLVAGPCTLSLVIGLTSQDMSENAIRDIRITGIKLLNPVFAGDTLHAASEVTAMSDDPSRPDAGFMTYRFTGRNQTGAVVVEGERTVLLKRNAERGLS